PTTIYEYDEVGNLKSVALPNGDVTTYTYDHLNRLQSEEVKNADHDLLAGFDYQLRDDGLRESVSESRRNADDTFSDVTIAWEYDADGRLISEFRDAGDAATTPNL